MQSRKSEVWAFEDDDFMLVESKLILSNVVIIQGSHGWRITSNLNERFWKLQRNSELMSRSTGKKQKDSCIAYDFLVMQEL